MVGHLALVVHPIPPSLRFDRLLLSARKALTANCKQPTLEIMKYLIPAVLAAFVLVGCDKQKSAIDNNADATKNAIDNRKDAVDAAAKEATKQADVDATIDKAKIEAKKVAKQAQLDADKQKADALAALEKAKLDAEKK